MSRSARPWRATAVATALLIATTPLVVGVPAFATTTVTETGPLSSGDDWAVTEVPGGYEVTKSLAAPIEIRSDVPTLWADGVELGIATESLDGLSLTVTTTDPAVADTTVVDQGWLGEGDPSVDAAVDESTLRSLNAAVPLAAEAPVLADDPSEPGEYTVERLDYNLGDEAEDIRDFDRKGEIRAAVYMPKEAVGERPVVVFLHGRHSSCGNGTRNPLAWPCNPDQVDIPSYLGYTAAAELLASQGYAVISISANAINALDGSLADDTGAAARGQLVLDHLELLKAANAGTAPVVEGAPVPISSDLTGRLDLDNVGLMGHSRGGEGIMRAALLNLELDEPFGIKSAMPLAPTDYTRMTVPGVQTAVVLPYCDGDVEDQMGQKFINDSRHAYGDDVLRTSILLMGGNHNFFNTVWTPGAYDGPATSDDWTIFDSSNTDPTCGASAPGRLNGEQQSDFGAAYLSGWFQLTLGGQDQFMPMFDGSDAEPASVSYADTRVSATLPPSSRIDITTFETPDTTIQAVGSGTWESCVSMSPLEVPATQPYCVTELGFAQAPDYGFLSAPYGNGRASSVPSTPSLHFTYTTPASNTAAAGEVRVPVPAEARDFSATENLSFRVSADDSIPVGGSTELTVTIADSGGGVASVTASDYGDALTVLPGSQNPLRKVLLQQIQVPVTDFAGVDLTDVVQVRFTAPREDGGVLLSDLALEKEPALGTAEISTRPFVSIPEVMVEEGAGISYAELPVVLSRPAELASTVYVSTISTRNGKVPVAMQKVDFAPGEVCKTVSVPYQGDSTTGTASSASFITNVTNTQQGVTIGDSFGALVIREDDGVTTGTPLPAVGEQGDACAEATAAPGTLTLSSATAEPGDTVTVTGSGYRVGESVTLTLYSTPTELATVVSSDGTVSFTVVIPEGTEFGAHELVAAGFGSGFDATGPLQVVDPAAPVDPGPSPEPTTDPTPPATGPDGTLTGSGSSGSGSGSGTSDVASSSSGNLASTGLQVAGWSFAALLLLAGGIVLFLIRRRAQAAGQE